MKPVNCGNYVDSKEREAKMSSKITDGESKKEDI